MRKLILALAFSFMSFCTVNRKLSVTETYKIAYLYDFKTELCFAVMAYNIKDVVHYTFTIVPCTDEVADEIKKHRYTISDFTKK